MQWSPPESNGGLEITGTVHLLEKLSQIFCQKKTPSTIKFAFLNSGYIVEKQVLGGKWLKAATLEPLVLQYCAENLKEKSQYIFKVYAENGVGLSGPACTDVVILETHASKCIVRYASHKDYSEITIAFEERCEIGQNYMSFVFRTDVPSPPTAPLEVRSLNANAVTVEWGVPETDGGSPLIGYTIAIKDVKKTMWMEVGRVRFDVQKFTIRDLQVRTPRLILHKIQNICIGLKIASSNQLNYAANYRKITNIRFAYSPEMKSV